ncbi:MAG: 4-hydroxy-tetrahydrodipicolinate synthase [Actinomycetota bacterium]|nr:4-hydroxy-tetrahydrodipicolinate synthase [Actinomycetota bacterium]
MSSQRPAPRFGRLVTAMVTPFDEQLALDLDGAVKLGVHLVASGSTAVVAAGTTGESPVLSDDERRELFRVLAERLTVPVIAGSTTNDTAHSVELTRAAEEAGAAAVLAVTPYYSRPSQTGLARHFAAIAEATSLPVLIYDIPVRTGRKVASGTMIRLAREHSNIVGVKDAAGDVAGTARLLAEAPAGFECYSGEDALTLPLLSVGALGAVSVASHWVGPEIAEMIGAFLGGDVEGARRLNADLVDAVAFQSGDEAPNPMPAKAMMRAMGLPAGQCRLPHGPAPEWLDEAADAVLEDLERWRAGRSSA